MTTDCEVSRHSLYKNLFLLSKTVSCYLAETPCASVLRPFHDTSFSLFLPSGCCDEQLGAV